MRMPSSGSQLCSISQPRVGKLEGGTVESRVSHERLFEGYLGLILGAVCSFIEPFCGYLSSNVDNTFRTDI